MRLAAGKRRLLWKPLNLSPLRIKSKIMARTVIPFGPQHPVLPEPVHLDLVVEDEKVIEARPSIGFVHRGLEKLVELKDFNEFVYVAERVCGICSFIHGQTYCQAIESMMNIAVPPRALYLRTIWGELSRVHSHLLWLGLIIRARRRFMATKACPHCSNPSMTSSRTSTAWCS